MKYLFSLSLLLTLFCACKSTNNSNQSTPAHKGNHLVGQSSPYLLQHAQNPVDWYPWGEEALAKAKKEDKMILVSVGYAACHWCHVMEHESFEDSLVAKVMNDNFVCIKVDREERPDVDDVYMTACHMATGKSCGWPLNAFALPDGRPVWAGTYFPKKEWLKVMDYFVKLRVDEPQKLEQFAQDLTSGIQGAEKIEINTGKPTFTESTLDGIATKFLNNIDFAKGGRKGAPKFPMPNNYEFLLAYHHMSGESRALNAVTKTLDEMAFGGIYDQLGGGFARYSTDADWKVPHFEKMLYDNGQLVSLYAEAYQLTKDPLYKTIVTETLAFIKRELTGANGGFYSSLDADSEGEEGKFYVWKKEEIDAVITDSNMNELFCDYYEIKKKGNWEHGNNILIRKQTDAAFAKKHKISEEEAASTLAKAEALLFAARAKRVRPGLDDKILTSWNALMLSGYVDAYRAFGEQSYLDAALQNANFLKSNMMQPDGRLNRNYKDGKSVINAFLDDYALTIQAFTALYQVTFDENWLFEADKLAQYALTHFPNEENSMFNYTSDLDPPLIARKMEVADNVIPGSNSAIARALHELGTFLYKPLYIERASQMMNNLAQTVSTSNSPNFYSNWCSLYRTLIEPPYEVAVIGDNYAALQREMMQNYMPNVLLLGGKTEGNLELLKDKLFEGETMIFVCQNRVCKFPVKEVDKALKLIE
ncbi:MAG: hypothetical protein ACI8YQ_002112 [Polaribacter sp.]|jgi:uncharacterized protein YyaL (SSP411 family)